MDVVASRVLGRSETATLAPALQVQVSNLLLWIRRLLREGLPRSDIIKHLWMFLSLQDHDLVQSRAALCGFDVFQVDI